MQLTVHGHPTYCYTGGKDFDPAKPTVVFLHGVLNDQATGEAFVREAATGVWHCTSSNRMGADDDRRAVTDEEGRVYGVTGLRVVDASIMPVVPCANTNFPTMMLAERIAAKIVEAA